MAFVMSVRAIQHSRFKTGRHSSRRAGDGAQGVFVVPHLQRFDGADVRAFGRFLLVVEIIGSRIRNTRGRDGNRGHGLGDVGGGIAVGTILFVLLFQDSSRLALGPWFFLHRDRDDWLLSACLHPADYFLD